MSARTRNALHGLDAAGVTARYAQDIRCFEQAYFARQPWLAVR
jgi:hypothetical protein